MEKIEKKFERISSHHWSDMSDVPCKVRISRINIVWALLLLSMSKKVKEALRTRLSRYKITWTETFVASKKIAKWKTTLNWGTLACYENLPIKSHYKKKGIFFVCNRNPPSPQLNRFRSLYRLFSNNSGNTNQKHLPLIRNNHCNSRLSENIHFYRNNRSIFFQSRRFQFSSPIFDGLCVFFNAHHLLMQKQFMCVDCYTGRLTFSNIIVHKRAIRWILVASLAEMRKDECVPRVVAYEGKLIVRNYWREIL